MTLASRVEVFTELSCRQLRDSWNHTSAPDLRGSHVSVHPQVDTSPSFTPLYLPSIPPPVQSLEESTGDGVSEGDDPRVVPGKNCVSDPTVQADTVRLQTIMTITMGTLSALTTGWWGHFGERYGRTRVLAISTLGLFLTYVHRQMPVEFSPSDQYHLGILSSSLSPHRVTHSLGTLTGFSSWLRLSRAYSEDGHPLLVLIPPTLLIAHRLVPVRLSLLVSLACYLWAWHLGQ